MPRYHYRCTMCDHQCVIQHLSDETVSICPKCNENDALAKQLTTFTTNNKASQRKAKVGQVTEEFIQSAREDLSKQKQDLKDKG